MPVPHRLVVLVLRSPLLLRDNVLHLSALLESPVVRTKTLLGELVRPSEGHTRANLQKLEHTALIGSEAADFTHDLSDEFLSRGLLGMSLLNPLDGRGLVVGVVPLCRE